MIDRMLFLQSQPARDPSLNTATAVVAREQRMHGPNIYCGELLRLCHLIQTSASYLCLNPLTHLTDGPSARVPPEASDAT